MHWLNVALLVIVPQAVHWQS